MGSLQELKNIENLLEKHFNEKLTIVSQFVKPLTTPGEHYGSIMVAVDITIKDEKNNEQDLHLVAKLIPKIELLREIFQVQQTFIKELKVYRKVVPLLAEIEEKYGVKNNRASEMFAKCYGGRSNLHAEEGVVDENSVLLLENLKTLGFETGDRLVGFDLETAEFVLKNLAIFHGTFLALKFKKSDDYEQEVLSLLRDFQKGIKETDKCQRFVDQMKEIISVNEKYREKVEEVGNDLFKKFTTTFYSNDHSNSPFVTFSHADFWVNNMMIKRNEAGKPVKFMIVDFQTPQSQSIVSDLLFFIYSSVSPKIVYEKDDQLIKLYHDSLIGCLKRFDIDLNKYSWELFNEEVKKNAAKVLSQILMMYKPILLERGQIGSMDDFQADHLLSLDNITAECKHRMVKTFTQFIEKGWL